MSYFLNSGQRLKFGLHYFHLRSFWKVASEIYVVPRYDLSILLIQEWNIKEQYTKVEATRIRLDVSKVGGRGEDRRPNKQVDLQTGRNKVNYKIRTDAGQTTPLPVTRWRPETLPLHSPSRIVGDMHE